MKYLFLTKHDQTPISRQNEIRNCILQILNSERNANRDPVNKGNNKITELRTILQRESQNS